MLESDVSDLVNGTGDAAFGVSLDGVIHFWNAAATEFFGVDDSTATGKSCCDLICGTGVGEGSVCQAECLVRQHAGRGVPPPAFDLHVHTSSGPKWANISILLAPLRHGICVLHLARDIDYRKQIEQMLRGFLLQVSAISGVDVEQMLAFPSHPRSDLTTQETAVLRLMVEGKGTRDISEALHVSPATVRNHIEHILRKLSSHSRVEAILRAIRDKLV